MIYIINYKPAGEDWQHVIIDVPDVKEIYKHIDPDWDEYEVFKQLGDIQ